MGKRTTYDKHPRDYYWTPVDAIKPLVPFIVGSTYAEPCAGGADIIKGIGHLTFRLGDRRPRCLFASDIQPDLERIKGNGITMPVQQMDALSVTVPMLYGVDQIVTNPPFSWNILSKLIPAWLELKPTWLLLPSDMASNVRFSRFMQNCSDVVPVGRVSWMGNGQSGMENYSWYCFDAAWNKGFARQWPR